VLILKIKEMKTKPSFQMKQTKRPGFIIAVLLFIIAGISCQCSRGNESKGQSSKPLKDSTMKLNKLTPEEERVIIHKGTERAFTGEYTDKFDKGIYTCRQCDAPLYRSDDKFHSNCGWPSFDDEIPGAVTKKEDADGYRTEILCAKCGAHLGHVFKGEGLTAKDTRHCVNSISMKFVPAGTDIIKKTDKAIFAGGCFWGVEYYFQHAPGVISTQVGYIGGHTENPTYKQVCAHGTGHVEAMEVTFDPSITTYEELAKLFFEIHDPTQANGQGNDIGEQYLSVIFYKDDQQKKTAEKLISLLQAKGYKVATQLRKATKFWPAEDYHQEYYEKEGGTPYCHKRVNRF
jgi:peptide methionine sulfoxide reductase msrA/msrB